MKSLKLFLINALTLLIGLGLMSGSFSQKNSESTKLETIPAIEATRLGNYRGQYLTVLYAVGSRPFISTDKSQLNLSQVKESRTVYISGDNVQLPSVQVIKEGFRPSYNIIVFVVSPKPNYTWVNADGSVPQGMSSSNNHSHAFISAINKSDVQNFATDGDSKGSLQVSVAQRAD